MPSSTTADSSLDIVAAVVERRGGVVVDWGWWRQSGQGSTAALGHVRVAVVFAPRVHPRWRGRAMAGGPTRRCWAHRLRLGGEGGRGHCPPVCVLGSAAARTACKRH